MTDSALLKIDRAAKHVADLNGLFGKARPFVLVLQTNTDTRKRSIRPKGYEAIINEAGLIAGDCVHNLRAALDHAYWEIISPHCKTDRERRSTQFPFTEEANRLDEALKIRFAERAGTGFYCCLRNLRPHGDPGGNELLYLIHEMDLLDKHRLIVPTDDEMRLSSDVIKNLVPDFPFRFPDTVTFSNCQFEWRFSGSISPEQMGNVRPPTLNIFERELDIPLDIVFRVSFPGPTRPVVPTLDALVDTARQTIGLMREAADSY